ncbi:MAG: hypothetical protein JWN22_423, partial [Nocardioides sp.]|nr:hypothetical protein [Nocardioides sp.]
MTSTAPTTLTARTPEDLLAVVPVVLGFVPGDSVVMLTFGSRRPFHARVDLPPDRSGIPEVVELLREPAFRHRVPQVVFVVYSAEQAPAKRVSRALVKAFRESGIEVIDVLRADGQRWFPMLHGRSCVPPWGVPYDVSAHPFAAQAVLDGRVTHGSRADLAASLEPEPDRVDAVAAAVARLSLPGGEPGGADAWALLQVLAHVVDGTRPGDEDAARLLVGLQDLAVRDAVWVLMDRDRSREHVAFWTDLVRRAPRALMPAPAALLAFAAWLSGHGATPGARSTGASAPTPTTSSPRTSRSSCWARSRPRCGRTSGRTSGRRERTSGTSGTSGTTSGRKPATTTAPEPRGWGRRRWVRRGVSARLVGVEEELLLVDPATGRASSDARRVLAGHDDLDQELFQHQIETQTEPTADLGETAVQLVAARRSAGEAARSAGLASVAVATSPYALEPHVSPNDRYRDMLTTYGGVARTAGTCGMHVHVAVDSPEEGVEVLDRIAPWLPTLLAVSANSPYADGADTGHASWRSQVWSRWPSAGPTEAFGSLAGYR